MRVKGHNIVVADSSTETQNDDKKNSVAVRTEVQRLYYEDGYSKNRIAERLGVSKGFVVRWTQQPLIDPTIDRRGWPQGKGRIYDRTTIEQIIALHRALCSDEQEFFAGATAIRQQWPQHYPQTPVPSLRQIGRIMAAEGLSQPRRARSKGASGYLCYPETTLYSVICARLLEADFIGKKYLRGMSTPVNFVGFSFKKAPRLRYFRRIEAQTTEALLRETTRFIDLFEKPEAIKVDNAMTMAGSPKATRHLSQFMHAMLCRQILPIFAVPRQPFTQASIEGNNSVFARKFWNRQEFLSLEEVDTRLEWFNAASERYCEYTHPTKKSRATAGWIPRVYFVRQVTTDPATKRGEIIVANESVLLDPALINYFVLAEWQPSNGILLIWFEKEQQPTLIDERPFLLNTTSAYKL